MVKSGLSTTQRYLGKVNDTEAIQVDREPLWIGGNWAAGMLPSPLVATVVVLNWQISGWERVCVLKPGEYLEQAQDVDYQSESAQPFGPLQGQTEGRALGPYDARPDIHQDQ